MGTPDAVMRALPHQRLREWPEYTKVALQSTSVRTWAHPPPAGGGAIIVAVVTYNDAPTGVTYGGVAMTQEIALTTNSRFAYVYSLMDFSAVSGDAVVVNGVAAGVNTGMCSAFIATGGRVATLAQAGLLTGTWDTTLISVTGNLTGAANTRKAFFGQFTGESKAALPWATGLSGRGYYPETVVIGDQWMGSAVPGGGLSILRIGGDSAVLANGYVWSANIGARAFAGLLIEW